ncbi:MULTISPECIES: serine protease [unclassified Bradyrhizobium]|uniref:trypsin-like serine peptidase n=1 Tax=unclassified Bradyrhizobium TaxID=2631580 RepID=UPI001FFB91D8|nr:MULTISPECIES: serine protease [unclassified Bradyrhizobium]
MLEEAPFPWAKPEAQELHRALCEIYPSSKGAMFAAVKAGLDPAMLFADQAAFLLWKDILDLAAGSLKVKALVERVRSANTNHPRRKFLDALMSPGPLDYPLDAQPRNVDGTPTFYVADDVVTEPEALLFHDDLTLPIGRVPWLISTLGRLRAAAPSVCKIECRMPHGNQRGTGFRISNSLLLTNWHVLHGKGARASRVTAEFGFEDDGQGGGTASRGVECDATTIEGKATDDWAVIQVNEDPGNEVPILPLSQSGEPSVEAPAFIIQHPGGERKRVAFVRNQITFVDDQVVQYLSDTQTGSSGAPVLNDQGRLIALHHSGGRPQEVAGKPPLRKNEGIRISRVRQGLTELGIFVA